MIPINDLRRAADSEGTAWSAAVRRVLERGWFLSGPELERFESSFADYSGAAHCLGVGNGTDALLIGLKALGVGPGSRVATVANAGFYTSSACLVLGAEPVFVDVLPDTACLDPAALARALDSGVDCVVATHLYGQLADVERIDELCRGAGVPWIEDCAQAAGARLGGRAAGTWADLGTFSFYPTKNLGAVGDAGAITTSRDDVADRVRRLRQYGWTEKYRVMDQGGFNSRMDELQAAVLNERLPALDDKNARRKLIALRFAEVAGRHEVTMFLDQAERHAVHLAVLATPARDEVRANLAKLGVATEIHYPIPDHQQPALAGRQRALVSAQGAAGLPVTEALARRVLTIPCFPELSESEVDTICAALDSTLAELPIDAARR